MICYKKGQWYKGKLGRMGAGWNLQPQSVSKGFFEDSPSELGQMIKKRLPHEDVKENTAGLGSASSVADIV